MGNRIGVTLPDGFLETLFKTAIHQPVLSNGLSIYCFIVLQARSLKLRCQQGHALCEGPERGFFLALQASDGCQQSLAFLGLQSHHSNLCLRDHMVLLPCLSLSIFPSFYKDISYSVRPTLIQLGSHLNICKDPILNKFAFTGTGGQSFNTSFQVQDITMKRTCQKFFIIYTKLVLIIATYSK